MTKIKILYLVSTLKKCGPVNVLYGIIEGLDKQQFKIYVVCLSKEEKGSMMALFEALGTKVIRLNNSRLKGVFKNKEMIQSIVASKSINIVHSHGLRADMINAGLKDTYRFTTIHNFPEEDYLLQFGKLKGSIIAKKHRKAIATVENKIACSESIKRKFLTEYGIDTHSIQNGIEFNSLKKTEYVSKTKLREKLGIDKAKNVFLVCGSLIKRKDPLIILKVFNQLNQNENCLILIGEGKLYKSLKSEHSSESIIFRGKVDNVVDYICVSDIFISASTSEGLPNAVLEAMYFDLPVILSDISSHKEIVGETYPFLFKTKNSIDLQEKMLDMLFLKDESSWESHSDLVEKKFSAKTMAENYTKKYLDQCQSLVQ